MTKFLKALPLGMAALVLAVGTPQMAAADHKSHKRHDGPGHYRHYKHHKAHKHHRRHRKPHHGHHHKKVVVHKHKHKYKHSYDAWPVIAALGIYTAYLSAKPSYAQPQVVYVERPPARDVASSPASAAPPASGPASTCLMTREYQTQVVVNGKLVDAYGHACLQPDGSWYRGPAVAATY